MAMSFVQISEVIERSTQGQTRPFLCKDENGQSYYVKGRGAGFRTLCCEWVASQLAVCCGLPIATSQIVRIPSELVSQSYIPDIEDLGAGLAFGSRKIENVVELRRNDIKHIDPDLAMRVLAFDWWIANPDRLQKPNVFSGNNPNLLWDARNKQLHVIDHNNAFSPFGMDEFGSHVFSSNWGKWDNKWKTDYNVLRCNALNVLDEIWWSMPANWIENEELVDGITLDKVETVLKRFNNEDFWNRTF